MSNTSKGRTIAVDPSLFAVRPARKAKPVHEGINPELISQLVDNFYSTVRNDPRLGPLFEEKVQGNWDPHLERMKSFWRSVLLKTGEYHGQPIPKHMALGNIEEDDFRIWLTNFREHAHALFEEEAANLTIQAAERIAQSLWLAKFGSPTNMPPAWLKSQNETLDAKGWQPEC